MRFDCDRIRNEIADAQWRRQQAKKEWHRWFAWRPVRCLDGLCRWLEVVEMRKGYYDGYYDLWYKDTYRGLKD